MLVISFHLECQLAAFTAIKQEITGEFVHVKISTMLDKKVIDSYAHDERNSTGKTDTVEVAIKEDGKFPNHFVQYTQETSFSGLKYIGETGSLARRLVYN